MAKVAIQGGVKNYLGNQKTVSNVPLKWQSGPDAPDTELAYITKAEKNLLLKKDLHKSLKNGPNTGPEGIMSLDSQGDMGGSEDKGTNDDGSNNPGNGSNYSVQDDLFDQSNYLSNNTVTNPSISDNDRDRFFAARPDYKAAADQAAVTKAKQQAEAKKEKKRIDKILAEHRGKTPAAYAYGPPIVNYTKNPFIGPNKFSTSTKMRQLAFKNLIDKKRGDKSTLPSAFEAYNLFNPSMVDQDYTYNTGITTDMMGVDLQDYSDMGKYGITGKNMTDIDRMNRALDEGRSSGNITQTEFEDAFNSQIIPGGGGGGQTILPYPYNVQKPDEEEVPEDTGPEYRFGTGQDVIFENYGTPGYRTTRAEGGIMGTRARKAMGGIMERVDKRQQFFLGGIGKAIGKAVGKVGKAAGKVLSSDIGKAAIAGAAFYYGGGGASMYKEAGLKGMAGNFFSKANPLLFSGGNFNPFKFAGLTTLIGAGMGPAKVDQMPGDGNRGGQLIDPLTGEEATPAEMRENIELAKLEAGDDADKLAAIDQKYNNMLNLQYQANLPDATPYGLYGTPGYRTTRAATGGRIGYNGGGSVITLMDGTKVQIPAGSYNSSGSLKDRIYSSSKGDLLREEIVRKLSFANGGRIGKAEGGLMDLGGMEKDYRAEGGFVPIGEYEKKDDVPARLSVNEFVFTADAVRGAGQGDIDKGAEIMENMMENLENGGTVSEESQGNKGAQNMFKTSERLGAVI